MQTFKTGMYVRFPVEERDDNEFRDFRIGQVQTVDNLAQTAIVAQEVHQPGKPPERVSKEHPFRLLQRCRILPDTIFLYATTRQRGRILIAAGEEAPEVQLLNYYVFLDGQTTLISEAEVIAPSTRQDADPWQQLLTYELQNPRWRTLRDQVIESMSELQNTTFGLEDLVGSRVSLLAHQAEVIAKVLSDPECRYILADEVGLGKTIEASVILKGLRRRNPQLKVLIVTPASLMRQWHNELNNKFWLDFAVAAQWPGEAQRRPGLILTTEELAKATHLWISLVSYEWDLIIVDEAHHIHKNPQLYERIRDLSANTPRALILSATPIQRRAHEYLSLLRLLDPRRYDALDTVAFQRIIDTQDIIRRTIAYLQPTLSEQKFDAEEFEEELEPLLRHLAHDKVLATLAGQLGSQGLTVAREIVAYVSENYRLESRVIRNRRTSIDIKLPKRICDTSYSYSPSPLEDAALERLYEYAEHYLGQHQDALAIEYCRLLLHAGASSPHALLHLIELRLDEVRKPSGIKQINADALLQIASPREEFQRIITIVRAVSTIDGEHDLLEPFVWQIQRWKEETDKDLASIRKVDIGRAISGRVGQIIHALKHSLEGTQPSKTLIFATWPQTLERLALELKRILGKDAVAQFHIGMEDSDLQAAADAFQEREECIVLICDELGGEGRNFQIADQIIHVDIPWTPAQIEQRIGRVDRLGRSGTVRSILPYAEETLEHQLVRIWNEAFCLFNQSMSGMEIALEGTLDELAGSIGKSVRQGLIDLLPAMTTRAAQLRETVAEERYFEDGAINHRLRDQFQRMSAKYSDGKILSNALLAWAKIAGLGVTYNNFNQYVRFDPKHFNPTSRENAKFLPPNMEEAQRRSGRMNNLVIEGTFNRDIAVRNERIVFLSPGDDPWTDAIQANAIEADRGRCCAIERRVQSNAQEWRGFDLLYSINIDPRPLFAAGYDPTHLFRAQGFLTIPTRRLLISMDGQVLKHSHHAWAAIRLPYDTRLGDKHLGKREGSLIGNFKLLHPEEEWREQIERIKSRAIEHLADDFSFTAELADEAQAEFARRAAGWRAANQRLFAGEATYQQDGEVEVFERASEALVEGLRQPIYRLESICFWVLTTGEDHA